jgi:hypothetical protein
LVSSSIAALSAVQGNLIQALRGNQIDAQSRTSVYFKGPQREVTFSDARLLGLRRTYQIGLDIENDQSSMKLLARNMSKRLNGAV